MFFLGPAIIFHRLCVAGESKIRPEVPSDDEEEGEEEEAEEQEDGQHSETADNSQTEDETRDSARKTVQRIVGLVSHLIFVFTFEL